MFFFQEITDLKEQLRDIMFYFEAQQKFATTEIATAEELQDSTIVLSKDKKEHRRKKAR